MNRKILALAIPSIISNITVPLLGLVDVAIVGHLGAPAYIGAIAVGGMLFNMLYWLFGFLRMGTSGLTSQAYGRRDLGEVAQSFVRSVSVGLGLSVLLILLQYPVLLIAFRLIETTPEIESYARLYFHICIWGAPAVLGLYSFAGWFVVWRYTSGRPIISGSGAISTGKISSIMRQSGNSSNSTGISSFVRSVW